MVRSEDPHFEENLLKKLNSDTLSTDIKQYFCNVLQKRINAKKGSSKKSCKAKLDYQGTKASTDHNETNISAADSSTELFSTSVSDNSHSIDSSRNHCYSSRLPSNIASPESSYMNIRNYGNPLIDQ